MQAPRLRLVSIVLVVALLCAGLMGMVGCEELVETEEEEKEPIVFSDRQWESVWVINHMARLIIEEGYGYPTEVETVSSSAFMAAMEDGDIHVDMELWRQNFKDWYEEVTAEGTMIDVGPVFDTSFQGWYVPKYVIEGCEERDIEPKAPDLESVHDLPELYDVFEDPEEPGKGRYVNAIAGWEIADLCRVKFYAYGLDENYNLMEPGSAGALDSAIVGAIEDGEPILTYYWEPTWLLGEYDMVALDEPEHCEDVFETMEKAAFTDEKDEQEVEEAVEFQDWTINTGVHETMKDRAPEVVEFLEDMHVGADPIMEAMAYMELEDGDPEDAAMWYFENYEERWRDWLPADVEENVEEALIEKGVDLSG